MSTTKPDKPTQASRRGLRRRQDASTIQVVTPPLWTVFGIVAALILVVAVWSVFTLVPTTASGKGMLVYGDDGLTAVPALSDGEIIDFRVSVGDTVKAGDTIAELLIADGSSSKIEAAQSGQVAQIAVGQGSFVSAGSPIVYLDDPSQPLQALLYLPLDTSSSVEKDMRVEISPAGQSVDGRGYVEGTVAKVAPYAVSSNQLMQDLGSDLLAQEITSTGPVRRVVVSLDAAPDGSGYVWSNDSQPQQSLYAGLAIDGSIVTGEAPALSLVIG